MLRFRTHAIGIVADVEKAFHHIGLHVTDRDFLRWLWLKDPTDPESEFVVYRFKVVPFGAKDHSKLSSNLEFFFDFSGDELGFRIKFR